MCFVLCRILTLSNPIASLGQFWCAKSKKGRKLAAARKPFFWTVDLKIQSIIFYWAKNYRSCTAATRARIIQQKRSLNHLLVIDGGLGAKPPAAGDMSVWKQSPQRLAILGILQQRVQMLTLRIPPPPLSAMDKPPLPLIADRFYGYFGQPLTKLQ